MKTKILLLLVCSTLLLLEMSCSNHTNTSKIQTNADTIALRYAHNLKLIEHKTYTEAILRNPWDTTKILTRYEIRTPLSRAAVFSSVHLGLLQELGVLDSVGGTCDVQYIQEPSLRKAVKEGRIRDLGVSYHPTIERIIELQPQAILPSAFENSGGYGGLDRLGIPIIPCSDYMESSPLARAEWIRFYGRLFGVADKADSLFLSIEQHYLDLKQTIHHTLERGEKRPTVLSGLPYQGIWHVAAGNSTTAQLIADAGADYCFSHLSGSGSKAMSLESVLEQAAQANLWFIVSNNPITYKILGKENILYTQFSAYKNRKIYICNANEKAFYEETPFHPEKLLANLINILHPNIKIPETKKYYEIITP